MSTELDLSFLIEGFDAPADPDALAGVLYAEDFDLAPPPPAPPAAMPEPEAPMPVYDETHIHAARLLGFEDGRRAALGDIAARAQLAEEAALLGLSRALADAQAAAEAAAQAAAHSSAHIMLDLLATALPQFCARHGASEALALTEALLPMLSHQPRITVRANPHTLPCLQQAAAPHQRDAPGRIALIPTDAMEQGDIFIEWQDGAATRDTTVLHRQFAKILAPIGLAETQAQAAQQELDHVG